MAEVAEAEAAAEVEVAEEAGEEVAEVAEAEAAVRRQGWCMSA